MICKDSPVKSEIVKVDDICVRVVWKKVKNINIRIKAPAGNVTVSAPSGVSVEAVIEIIRSKYQWISEKQSLLQRSSPKIAAINNTADELMVWGEKYPVEVVYTPGKSRIYVNSGKGIIFRCNGKLSPARRTDLVNGWYRHVLQAAIADLLEKWLPVVRVDVREWRIRCMRTRWGSCNVVKRRIWFNLELAKLPQQCLEYVVVHELVHLLERNHNARFWGLVESFLPDWRERRAMLKKWEVYI